ncbi:hypothetical protein AYO44_13780 [Planctomycetaceae bacterium SCGC AG-212-F19]|nr:hypothetical protein AYO44_13780 [Planctomycetaceae bacterium SCGC AG-212-F19]
MTAFPKRSWFLMQPPSDLHGLGHTARVMVWAAVLTRETEWFEPVVWAAACHDLRREDDGDDPDHGFRAGLWVHQQLSPQLRQPLDGLELIAQACDWHVCSDREAGWDHPVLWLLKDADGLDRVRLYDLDPSYLRHSETRQWIKTAMRLYEATADDDDLAHIWQVAVNLHIPIEELTNYAEVQARRLLQPTTRPPETRT